MKRRPIAPSSRPAINMGIRRTVTIPRGSKRSRSANGGTARMSSITLSLPVRKTSGHGQKSSIGSQRSIPANLGSVLVTTRPSSKANSKPIMPVGSSRRHTLLLCAPNCSVMVRSICPNSRSGADSFARASKVLLSTAPCPRAKFSEATSASAASFRSVISVPVAYQ